ncbi:MAG: EamA family transporter [Pseudomonadota bacterium]
MNNVGLYIVTVLIWGSTWLGIEFQLGVVSPEVSVFYRYLLACVLLFGWSAVKGLNLRFDLAAHGRFALLGLLLFGLNYVFAYHAQRYIDSALMAITFSTLLWMNIINARVFFGERIQANVVGGSVLGIAGVVMLFAPSIANFSLADATVFGALLSLISAYIASLGNMASQAAQRKGLPIVQSNAWGMFYGSVLTAVFALVQGKAFVFDFSAPYVLSLLYLVVFGSILAFGAYLTLLGRIGAGKAGYAMVLFPVVALILSVFFEDFTITPQVIFGVCLVLLGNVFVMRPVRPKPELAKEPSSAT